MNIVLREHVLEENRRLELVKGDITSEEVDAIVNAANERLQHGGGVAWAITRHGGQVIQQESDEWVHSHGPVSHARPAWTQAGLLPAKYVIHAVGPVWGDGDEDAKLAAAIRGSLRLADELGLGSIAFPAISTGIFGFPKGRAAGVIFSSIKHYFRDMPDSGLKSIRITLFDQPTIDAFLDAWKDLKL
jgi:O-acetyl-ADP-ribose deacetylase (regulator of RNase III)